MARIKYQFPIGKSKQSNLTIGGKINEYQFPIGKGKYKPNGFVLGVSKMYQFPIGKGKFFDAHDLKVGRFVSIPNRER